MSRYPDRRGPDNTGLWVMLVVLGGLGVLVLALCAGVVWVIMSAVRSTQEVAHDFQNQAFKQIDRAVKEQQEAERQRERELREAEECRQAARAFLDAFLAGQANAAWEVTTPALRQRWDRKRFDATARRLSASLGEEQPVPALNDAGPRRYRATWNTVGGERFTLTVGLAQDGGRWRVDELALDDERRGLK